MRNIGFDYYWTDLYCQNLLAGGFEISSAKLPFSAVTAFEVLEHVPDPMELLAQALDRASTRTIIVSTELFEGAPQIKTGDITSLQRGSTSLFISAAHWNTSARNWSLISIHMAHCTCSCRSFRSLSLTSKTVSDHVSLMKGRLHTTGGAPSSKALDEAWR
jgi:hypothetical protein